MTLHHEAIVAPQVATAVQVAAPFVIGGAVVALRWLAKKLGVS